MRINLWLVLGFLRMSLGDYCCATCSVIKARVSLAVEGLYTFWLCLREYGEGEGYFFVVIKAIAAGFSNAFG